MGEVGSGWVVGRGWVGGAAGGRRHDGGGSLVGWDKPGGF